MVKEGTIAITLKSDLCAASGYSYAGIVDTEVCYDKHGIPYIPGRRLKGCFRETAENLLHLESSVIDQLFGKAAQSNSGSLSISNARIENYEAMKYEIEHLKEIYKELFSAHRILEQFTHVISQTELADGVANDQSLRFMRVINHYSPAGSKEMVFICKISFEEQYEENLKKIICGTKNIGLKRNRGFGAVSCRLVEKNKPHDQNISVSIKTQKEDDADCIIQYTLINEEPLVLNAMNGGHSEKYINGQTILGTLAGKYLSSGGKSDCDEFKNLFLNGRTKYVNAYPSDKGNIFYPAPLNINKHKKSKAIINTLLSLSEPEPGDQPKKMKGKFTCISGNEIQIKDVDMKLHYHHRKDKKDEEGILYAVEAVEPDQEFSGQIYTTEKYKNKIIQLLSEGTLSFGQSKNTEYGTCRCTEIKEVDESVVKVGKGDLITVTLLTDAVIVDETNGNYTVDVKKVEEQIKNILLSDQNITEKMESVKQSMIETALVSGYQTKWNLNKPLFPIIKSGSVFVFKAVEDKEFPDKIWIGIKNQEGFGFAQVGIVPAEKDNVFFDMSRTGDELAQAGKSSEVNSFKSVKEKVLKKQLLNILVAKKDINLSKKISKTQIGRVTLMLRQSLEYSPVSVEQFKNFCDRISSIKNDDVRKEFEQKLINPLKTNGSLNFNLVLDDSTFNESAKSDIEVIKKTLGETDINGLWGDYLKLQLTKCKYEAKED